MRLLRAAFILLALALPVFAVPHVTLVSPVEGGTYQLPVSLQYAYDADGTGPSSVTCIAYYYGVAVTQAAIVPAGGSTSAAYSKIPGQNSIVVRCEGAGFYQEISRSFTIDAAAPVEPKVTASFPPNQYAAPFNEPVDFAFTYEKGDSPADYVACYLEFFNSSPTFTNFVAMASVNSGMASAIASPVPADVKFWTIECYDPSEQDLHFPINSGFRNISIGGYPGYVMLEYPEYGADVSEGGWPAGTFIYSYVANGGPYAATCSLYIDGRLPPADTRQVDSETSNVVQLDISGLAQGAHQWQVSCINGSIVSETRPFIIMPDFLDAWSVSILYPAAGSTLNFPANATFIYKRGKDTAPYAVWCHGSINGEQRTGTYGAITGIPTQLPLPISSGYTELQIACEYNGFMVYSPPVAYYGNAGPIIPPITPPPSGGGGGASSPVGSGGGSFLPRPLPRTATASAPAALAVENVTPPAAARQIEIETAVLTAPAEGTVGEQVSFILKSSAGKPLSASDVFIRVPNSTLSLKATTDSQGKASFVPQAAGLYSYRAAGYSLAGNPTTLVMAKKQEAQKPGFDLGGLGSWLLLLLALILLLVILYSAYKIISGKPEPPPGQEGQGTTQP